VDQWYVHDTENRKWQQVWLAMDGKVSDDSSASVNLHTYVENKH